MLRLVWDLNLYSDPNYYSNCYAERKPNKLFRLVPILIREAFCEMLFMIIQTNVLHMLIQAILEKQHKQFYIQSE
jgi:hypothetical protein